MNQKLEEILAFLPDKPGVYQYYDADDKILYVGKAKSLQKRVRSYFNKQIHDNTKTAVLVRKIADIKYILVDTEFDALLLENSLIKKYKPRYNILLKDDKTYPWICIKNERFPRIFSTRKIIKDGSEYFGPYASGKVMHTLLDLIKELYPLRNCFLDLSQDNIEKGKYRACLEYQIGNCKAPCENKQTEDDYSVAIKQIKHILRGNIFSVIKLLKEQMNNYAEAFEFEKAHETKLKLETLEQFQSKSTIVNPNINDIDVYSIATEGDECAINFMKIMNGSIVQSHTLEVKKKLDESQEEILQLAIAELRERFNSESKEMLVPFELGINIPKVEVLVPKIGDKKQLLDLSMRNARYYLFEKRKKEDAIDPLKHENRILQTLQNDLHLKELPRHIECFDNSNFQGTDAVSACVVFKNAKPSKKEYRHFNVKTVEGPDDFATMREVIFRRYKRLVDEKQPLPQLIVIDGGKGQLSAAIESLKEVGVYGQLAVVGIAKRLEEIYFPEDPLPLYLDKKSESLKVLQHLRNEAHRFGITHHRNRRSKKLSKTSLSDIDGIGPKTAELLLQEFKSIKRIKEASEEEIAHYIGISKARILKEYL